MSSLRFLSGKDYMQETESVSWVLQPFVAVGSSMMLYGRQGLGKSTIMMQLVHSLGTGEPWMGFPVHKTGKTLYLGVDMTDSETRAILERCEEAGLSTMEHIILPRPPEGEDALSFDIFDPEAWQALKELCDREKPVAVIVDAIQDTFSIPPAGLDVNQFNREVLKRFKLALGDAVLIFLNHRRKKSAFQSKGDDDDDDDSFMGGTTWESKVAASIMLGYSSASNRKFLRIQKTRLAPSPGKIVLLDTTREGFFEVQLNLTQVLDMWPHCIPDPEARQTAVDACKSQRDVFRSVATLTGEKFESVKSAFHRGKKEGLRFAWADALSGPAKPSDGDVNP